MKFSDGQVILGLFRNESDVDAFNPLLQGLSGLIRMRNLPEIGDLAETLGALSLEPSLLIVSSRLYPQAQPQLVAELRGIYPGAEILLVTLATDPLPPLERLAGDRIRHLLVTPEEEISSLQDAVRRLLQRTPWNLRDYVGTGSIVHEFPLTSSGQKEALIASLEEAIGGESPEMELLRQRAALLADEMVENALYGAPKGEDGRKLYCKGEERVIGAEEKIAFRYAFDGETLAMEIVDGWGTLAPESVVDFLARNQMGMDVESDETGGRGLFIIWRFLDHLHVNIRPGMQTVLGGHLRAVSTFDCESPRGFSISTEFAAA